MPAPVRKPNYDCVKQVFQAAGTHKITMTQSHRQAYVLAGLARRWAASQGRGEMHYADPRMTFSCNYIPISILRKTSKTVVFCSAHDNDKNLGNYKCIPRIGIQLYHFDYFKAHDQHTFV